MGNGKRGRPAKPVSPYIMRIHQNGKYRYASTQRPSEQVNADGVHKFKHIHWGSLDSNNVFHPNSAFLYLPRKEKEKFVFPDDWDLSELQKSAVPQSAPTSEAVLPVDTGMIAVAQSRSYGAVWLLERIGEQLGVREDLMVTFENNQSIVDDIMTVAMYLFITNYNLDRLEEWQQLEKYPSRNALNPPAVTMLQKSITEQNRIDFLKCRAQRIGNETVMAVDSTSKTGFGVKLIDLTWGKNKEGLDLPVTVEVVVYSITDHIPVYYKTFAGNTHDARSVGIIMADLKEAGFTNYILLMDRAYPSLKNIDRFIRENVKIVACMKAGVGFSLSRIKSLGHFDYVPEGFVYDADLDLYTRQFDLERSVLLEDGSTVRADQLKLNLYFDPVRRSSSLKNLDRSLEKKRCELDQTISRETAYYPSETQDMEDEYGLFELNWKSIKIPIEECPEYQEDEHRRGRKRKFVTKYILTGYNRNEKSMMHEKITAGFRTLVTLGVPFSANEAMVHYGLRAEQEMDNEQWKTLFQCDRERNSSEAAKAGASFIQFVGRIMSCWLRYKWCSSLELRKMFKSSLTIIDEMRRVRCIEYPEQSEMHLTPFIGRQLDICRLLDIAVPQGCGSKG